MKAGGCDHEKYQVKTSSVRRERMALKVFKSGNTGKSGKLDNHSGFDCSVGRDGRIQELDIRFLDFIFHGKFRQRGFRAGCDRHTGSIRHILQLVRIAGNRRGGSTGGGGQQP